MVKVENDESYAHVEPVNQTASKIESPDLKPIINEERNLPSSSYGHLKSYFVGMGFSSALVDKVIAEHGETDANVLLEALFSYSALQESSPERSDSGDGSSKSDKQDDSPIEFTDDDDDNKDEDLSEACKDEADKSSYLLMMDFSEDEVKSAIDNCGESASLAELVDFIVASQTAGCSKLEESTPTLFGTMDRTLCLLKMGFTENEISSVIDKFGPEAPFRKLADSIVANRSRSKSTHFGYATEECEKRPYLKSEIMETDPTDTDFIHEYEDCRKIKKAKHVLLNEEMASCSNYRRQSGAADWEATCKTEFTTDDDLRDSVEASWVKEEMPDEMTTPYLYENSGASWIRKEVPDKMTHNLRGNANASVSRPPYFFYGNVVDVPQDTWNKLSQFLYGTEPEFANAQFFSALVRKEGYIHNLPTKNRFHILPKPPTTIEDTLPHTKKWWPSWDTRKQLSCINTDVTGADQLSRLGRMMRDSRGILSREQQTDILYQCKKLNLLWVGQDKLSPIEPDQLECILGYPMQHTQISELDRSDRLKVLKYSFQTDTLGYHLSTLKLMHPHGLRVLSLFTGIGGAEVALHRLGIKLKCVVSVEACEINRRMMRRWWQQTGQCGELKQIASIEQLTIQKLESLINQHGGFDIIIGGNPGTFVSGSCSGDFSMGMDLTLFFEFVRVFQRTRSIMGRSNRV